MPSPSGHYADPWNEAHCLAILGGRSAGVPALAYADAGHQCWCIGVTSIQVINDWLAAWQAGDRQALHRLLPAGSVVHASQPPRLAGEYLGFEAAAEYFGRRAQHAGAGFSWEAGELIEAGPFVVVPFRLQADHRRPWWQLAVYRTENGHIAEIWLLEESQAPNDELSDAARRPVQP